MKKIIALLLTLALVFTLSLSFAEGTVRVAALKGPTAMGLVKMLDENDLDIEFTLAGSADEITPKLIQGQLDIAAVPVNLASVLYNKTNGGVRLIAVNALGVLYIVEKGGETVQSVADLKGKTVYATGKGSTPEYNLTYLLAQNGLDINTDVNVQWKSEPTEVVALLKNDETGVAMLPQPYVTVAQTQVEGLRVAVDMTAAWDALENGSRMVTAGIVARTEFIEAHPDVIEAFLSEYALSASFVNENTADAAALIEKFGIVKAAVAEKALPGCNIVCLVKDEMAAAVSGYLTVLNDLNPKSVGGALPGEDFYYGK